MSVMQRKGMYTFRAIGKTEPIVLIGSEIGLTANAKPGYFRMTFKVDRKVLLLGLGRLSKIMDKQP